MDLAELFDRGGPLMWVILGCSIVATMAFVDRLIALRRSVVAPPNLFASLRNHLAAHDIDRARQLCREQPAVLTEVVVAGLDKRASGRAAAKEGMEEAGSVAVGRLQSWVGVMATVAAIAPLLGLLGTVTGMIEVFFEIESAQDPDISRLSGGIKEALYTTGAGLTVAIPVFVAYRYIEGKIDRYAQELEERSLVLLDLMLPETPRHEGVAQATTEDAP